MPDATATIELGWSPSPGDAAATLAAGIDATSSAPYALVPSTLDSADPSVTALRRALRAGGHRTTVLAPRGPAALAASLLRRGDGPWRHTATAAGAYRIDARLPASPYAAIAIVDVRHRLGPFVLDLASRFLHPADRVRLLASRDRPRAVAAVAAAAPPAVALVLAPVEDGWLWAHSRDVIATELWALALAERWHDPRLELRGPWEDPTVQRATELELGARIPQEIALAVAAPLPNEAESIAAQAARRIGLPLAARNVLRSAS